MQHVVFACFAHPDDEAFGPSGTLYKLARSGAEVHLILLTGGDGGRNPDGHPDLGAIRLEEWQASARLIGATSVHALGYKDGQLSNHHYLDIAGQLLAHAGTILEAAPDAKVTLITNDPNGITGHLDHIFAAMVTTYVSLKLRQPGRTVRLKYACVPDTAVPAANTNWLYMPRGRRLADIDEINDISDVSDKKLAIMKAHLSQRDDMKTVLGLNRDILKREYFLYYKD